jgi:hypothetical protein
MSKRRKIINTAGRHHETTAWAGGINSKSKRAGAAIQ